MDSSLLTTPAAARVPPCVATRPILVVAGRYRAWTRIGLIRVEPPPLAWARYLPGSFVGVWWTDPDGGEHGAWGDVSILTDRVGRGVITVQVQPGISPQTAHLLFLSDGHVTWVPAGWGPRAPHTPDRLDARVDVWDWRRWPGRTRDMQPGWVWTDAGPRIHPRWARAARAERIGWPLSPYAPSWPNSFTE